MYDLDNPVEEDGTYENGKFVCDSCYCLLIDKGCDVGKPSELQQRAEEAFKNEGNSGI